MSVAGKFARVGLAVSAFAFGAGLGAVAYGYRSLPRWSGTIEVSGSRAPIQIIREQNAIPRRAAS